MISASERFCEDTASSQLYCRVDSPCRGPTKWTREDIAHLTPQCRECQEQLDGLRLVPARAKEPVNPWRHGNNIHGPVDLFFEFDHMGMIVDADRAEFAKQVFADQPVQVLYAEDIR